MIQPTIKQLEWDKREIGVIIHYDIQVFEPISDEDAKNGKTPRVSVFNPTHLDTDQWLETAKSAGAKYAILVAKHCTGFCLWDTKAHNYNVMNSPYGKDIVAQFIASCKKYDIAPGLYYSLACNYKYLISAGRRTDDNRTKQRNYYDMAKTQLTELWSNYGELAEIWFDGGIIPKKEGGIDLADIYEKYQPNAIKFQGSVISDKNNLRWSGNEEGVCEYDNYSTTDICGEFDGRKMAKNVSGDIGGKFWSPVECDTPNRKMRWFYRDNEDRRVIPARKLLDKYCNSVGHNGNIIIGMVINKEGLVPDKDKATFAEFGGMLANMYSDLVYSVDFQRSGVFDIGKEVEFNTLIMEEDMSRGHCVNGYEVYVEKKGKMRLIHAAKVIGNKRIVRLKNTKTSRIQVKFIYTTQGVTNVKLSLYNCK